jgi:hypothetical protein
VIIKVLLIGALAVAAYVLLHGRPSALNLLLRRGLMLLTVAGGVVAVLFPDTVTEVAHVAGVGRGADLLLYVACIAFLFTIISLHLRLAALRDQYVELARHIALGQADPQPSGDRPYLAGTSSTNETP